MKTTFQNDIGGRHDFVAPSERVLGEAARALDRALGDGTRSKDLSSPFNEGFTFHPEEYRLLLKTRPALADPDPRARHLAWKRWAITSEARAFRVK